MSERDFHEWFNTNCRKSSIMNTNGSFIPIEAWFSEELKCIYHRWVEGINLNIRSKGPYEDGSGVSFEVGIGLHPNFHPDPKLAQRLAHDLISVLVKHFERTHYEYDNRNQVLIGIPRKAEEDV